MTIKFPSENYMSVQDWSLYYISPNSSKIQSPPNFYSLCKRSCIKTLEKKSEDMKQLQ